MLTHILERDAEFLKSPNIFHSDGDNLLLHNTLGILALQDIVTEQLGLDHLLADELGDLNLARKKDLEALDQSGLSPVLEEVFHTAVEASLEELLKAVRQAKLFIRVCQ